MIDMWLLLVVRFIQSEYLLNYVFSFWFGHACFAKRCFKPVRDKWIIKIVTVLSRVLLQNRNSI